MGYFGVLEGTKVVDKVEVKVETEEYEALEKFGNDIWPFGIIPFCCFLL